jgi:hypothetical protein
MKIIFLLLTIFFNTGLYAKLPIQDCFYGQAYKFDDNLLIPSQIYTQDTDKGKIEEFSFDTSLDETVILSDQIPALYIHEDNSKFYKKILNEVSISEHKFEKKIQKNKITVIVYESVDDTNNKILFIFTKDDNKYLGSVEITKNMVIKRFIVDSLILVENKQCSKEKLWSEYEKLSYMDINQRMKILFSLYSVDQKDTKIKETIVNLMQKKKKVLDLAISNIQETP